MENVRLGVPKEVAHRHKRGWILLSIITGGLGCAAALWVIIFQNGPVKAVPLPPAPAQHVSDRARKNVVTKPIVIRSKQMVTPVEAPAVSSPAVANMIRQVQEMQQKVQGMEAEAENGQ